MRSFVFLSQTGCLLPLLIFLNLFFGWMFFKTGLWLLIGIGLILLFVLNAVILSKKIFSTTRKRDNAIDVEGEIVEDKHKLT